MSVRRERQQHQAAFAKPSSPELTRRNREAGLNRAIMFYEERPDPLPEVGAWLERSPVPKFVLVDGGIVFEVELTEVV
jgi:hypothetical protein